MESKDTKPKTVMRKRNTRDKLNQETTTEEDLEDPEDSTIAAEPITPKKHPQSLSPPTMQEAKNPEC